MCVLWGGWWPSRFILADVPPELIAYRLSACPMIGSYMFSEISKSYKLHIMNSLIASIAVVGTTGTISSDVGSRADPELSDPRFSE